MGCTERDYAANWVDMTPQIVTREELEALVYDMRGVRSVVTIDDPPPFTVVVYVEGCGNLDAIKEVDDALRGRLPSHVKLAINWRLAPWWWRLFSWLRGLLAS